jgi:6,7-dimethyl-8-ribityllumazine synthase
MSTQRHLADFDPDAVAGAKILIVETSFNSEIVAALHDGAVAVLDAAGAAWEVVTVPGALEAPAAVSYALRAEEKRGQHFDGYVVLGCVIRGETGHYDIVAGESSRALMDLVIENQLALGNGILTVENDEQAWERADRGRLDKGGGAASAALAMVALQREFGL